MPPRSLTPHHTGYARFLALLLTLPTAALAFVVTPPIPQDPFQRNLRPLLVRYCFDCHDAETAKGGVNLEPFATQRSVQLDPKRWETITRLIRDQEMPPARKPHPTPEERDQLVDGLLQTLRDMDLSLIPKDPGVKIIHRLNRLEYNNSVRDLLGVSLRPADDFPADGSGGGGFDNHAAALFLPPILFEKYLAAAHAVASQAPANRVALVSPGFFVSPRTAARLSLAHHAFRAFRGPVSEEELDRLLLVYDTARSDGADWEQGLRTALQAILVSPRFLYRIEHDAPTPEPHPINNFELATRLSYFLWASTPDDTLLELARQGTLRHPEILTAQVQRLLLDPKAEAFARDFVTQWLGIRRLATGTAPDRRRYPDYTPALRDAMIEEPVRFFLGLLRDDRSLLDLLHSDYTYANPELAKVYDIEPPPDPGWHRVTLTNPNRGGVLTMPAVLTVTSFPQRTSPVLRGKWILEDLLGAPTPPPPPNAGGLPPDDQPREGLTFRQRLEQHRSKPECAACHARMDPLGFGLENFDAMGRWRSHLGDLPVDASGQLPSGESFQGPAELKQLLLARQDEFLRHLSEKMLAYALGRGLEYYDVPTIRQLSQNLRDHGQRATVLIQSIVASYPFQYRRNPSADPDSFTQHQSGDAR